MLVLTAEQISVKLNKVIDSIENSFQINTEGIKKELEKIVKPEGKSPNFEGGLPQIYVSILTYYEYVCDIIDKKREGSGPNQVGALSKLKGILDTYSNSN